MTPNTIAEDPKSPTFRVDELAVYLGLSRGATYRGLATGEIPAVRVGKRFIIPRQAVRDWLLGASELRKEAQR